MVTVSLVSVKPCRHSLVDLGFYGLWTPASSDRSTIAGVPKGRPMPQLKATLMVALRQLVSRAGSALREGKTYGSRGGAGLCEQGGGSVLVVRPSAGE